MSYRILNIVIRTSDDSVFDSIVRNIPKNSISVMRALSDEELFLKISGGRANAVIIGGATAEACIAGIRNKPETSFIPVFVVESRGDSCSPGSDVASLADGCFSFAEADSTNMFVSSILAKVQRRVDEVFHPVSGLCTGAALRKAISSAVVRPEKSVFMLMVKLHGIKAFNLYKSYEDGDKMIFAVASAISGIVTESGGNGAFAGHNASDEFVIFTSEKRVETICKNILIKTERLFRSFYTPFELMKGYITLEGEKSTHYYLAEIMIAGIEIPAHWDAHYIYLIDLLKDTLKKVEADDLGYRIVKL